MQEPLQSSENFNEPTRFPTLRRCNSSYYTEKHGRALQKTLDEILISGKKGALLYKNFHQKPHTLIIMIHAGWNWLIDNADHPDKRYARLKALTTVRRLDEVGAIVIDPKPQPGEPILVDSIEELPQENLVKDWREKVDTFLAEATSDTPPLDLQGGLHLSAKEKEDLRSSLLNISGFISIIETTRIRIIKE